MSVVRVEPRQFDRPLHGKAYWSTDGQSALIGSPNLTRPALLQPADSGNYEAAVVFSDLRDGFPAAPSSRWDGDNIRETAARRSALKPFESHPTVPDLQSFSAWEDDGAIALSSVPDGTTIQYGTLTGWHDLGIAQSESVDVPEGVRPHLLRAVIGARTSLAVVHRVGELRTGRLRPRHTRSSGTLSGTLPLDPEDQRILEKVLGDLFALASLVNEKRARTPRLPTPAARESASNTQLSRWLPAQPDDEPRVPDLYRQVWEKSRPVDVLLALARTALRLDDVNPFVSSDELDVSAEMRDIEDLDAEDEAISVESEHDSAPETTRDVLSRYRKAFMRRLSELVKFIAIVDDQDLADLAFQVTLVQHERLTLEVRIDGEIVPLIEPKVLLNQKMELLSVYLGGGGDDPLCMETARYHLAECLRNSDVWNPLQREKLENLAYQHGQRILNTPLPYHPAPELLGMDLDEADGWIESLTNRTDWSAITRHASEYLSDASLHTEPFPYIIGSAAYSKISHAPGREGSPAWDVIGYGAIAGLADKEPYGIGVRNSDNDGPFLVHVLVTEPKRSRLYEAALRRTDEVWIWRYYSPIYRKALEDAAKFGPMALDDAYREPWKDSDLASLPKAVRVLATTTGSIVDQKGY